jgi:hypothetical protein
MYILNMVVFPLTDGKSLALTKLLLGIPIWIIAGLLYGYTNKLIYRRKHKIKT